MSRNFFSEVSGGFSSEKVENSTSVGLYNSWSARKGDIIDTSLGSKGDSYTGRNYSIHFHGGGWWLHRSSTFWSLGWTVAAHVGVFHSMFR